MKTDNCLSDSELFDRARHAVSEGFLDHSLNMCQILEKRLINDVDNELWHDIQLMIGSIKEKINNKKTLDVIILGDSLSLPRPENLREYDASFNPFLSTRYKDTYPVVLEGLLQQLLPDSEIKVINLSKRSYTVLDLVDMRHDVFCWYNPDVIIIQVGLVDCFPRGKELNQQNVTINDFERYMNLVVEFRNQACPSKKCIFIGVSPTDKKTASKFPTFPEYVSAYNQVIQSLCENGDNLFYLDMYSLFDEESPYELLHYDAQHLSTVGHNMVAGSLLRLLLPNEK